MATNDSLADGRATGPGCQRTGLWHAEAVSARDPADPSDVSTRDALLDAALDQLRTKGVLAGLNLREVADAVGVTPANIYHYFGGRQGLLRTALARETDRLTGTISEVEELGFAARRLLMFDAIGANPRLALTALLALDGDPEYEPLPFLDGTLAHYRRLVDAGELRGDLDVEAVHLLGLAASIWVAIYAEAAARQLGTTPEALRARTRSVLEQFLGQVEAADPEPATDTDDATGR